MISHFFTRPHRVFNLDCELVSQLPIEIIYWYLNKYGKTE